MIYFAKQRFAISLSIVTAIACWLIVVSNVIYFTGEESRFHLEKGALARNPWWLATFYFHIVGASISLAAGLPLMFPAWTRKYPAWHRWLGYLYFNAVLWMAAPTGLVLAFTAKGGLLGTAGFVVAGLMWWQTTWAGYQAIRRHDLPTHIRAMVRSFAWALSAPAFRIIQIALYAGGLDDTTNYVLSLWLSMAASVWLAESCLFRIGRSTQVAALAPSPSTGVLS
ncbi:DUF2306 domain-containing protein [Anatilimnocola sp. NA78]|uniref:DUF2306 domain-containing protein n=1 Tax=Anatilimnocola sp. NA78 TaxID=3415683 RepID=UPI003CE5A757